MSVKVKKRRQQRISLTGYLAIFLEDSCNYTGTLKEISVNGLRVQVNPISSRLISGPSLSWFHNSSAWQNRKFSIIISKKLSSKNYKIGCCASRQRKNYMMTAYPRWLRKKDDLMEIGLEIPENYSGWKIFVQQRIREVH